MYNPRSTFNFTVQDRQFLQLDSVSSWTTFLSHANLFWDQSHQYSLELAITSLIKYQIDRQADLNAMELYNIPGVTFSYPAKSILEILIIHLDPNPYSIVSNSISIGSPKRDVLIKYLINNGYTPICCLENCIRYVIKSRDLWLFQLILSRCVIKFEYWLTPIIESDLAPFFECLIGHQSLFDTHNVAHMIRMSVYQLVKYYKAKQCLKLLLTGPSLLFKMLTTRAQILDSNKNSILNLNRDVISIICRFYYCNYYRKLDAIIQDYNCRASCRKRRHSIDNDDGDDEIQLEF